MTADQPAESEDQDGSWLQALSMLGWFGLIALTAAAIAVLALLTAISGAFDGMGAG